MTNWPVVPIPTDAAMAWDVTSVPEAEREWYRKSDPVLIFIRELVKKKKVSKKKISEIQKSVLGVVSQAVKFAFDSPYPNLETALEDVFA
jgi:pyruvate dehydrogenase E1 component alpha subunit